VGLRNRGSHMTAEGAKRRDALYYPSIHIDGDITWLKATLLCFPHLLRMAPAGFEVNDSAAVKRFAETEGAGGQPLVGRVDLVSDRVAEAQGALAGRLARDVQRYGPRFLERFSRERARLAGHGNDSTFQIHRDKLLELPQRWGDETISAGKLLRENDLVWEPHEPNRGGDGWYGIHPELGEVLMSTMACVVAGDMGLDIVTNDGTVHYALSTADPAVVYDALILGRAVVASPDSVETTDEIVQLVVLNRFDVSRLNAEDIASFSRDGEALFDFRAAVAQIAARVPAMVSGPARDRALKDAANEVLEHWNDQRLSMSRVARDFFSLGLLDRTSSLIEKALASLAPTAGVGSAVLLGSAPGLAVGVTIYSAGILQKHWRTERAGPYRYLSTLVRGGAALVIAPPEAAQPQPAYAEG
jgi:hypothetical protein